MAGTPEFAIDPEQFQTPETLDVARSWFHMSVYTQMSERDQQAWHQRWGIENFPELRGFLKAQEVLELADNGKIAEAMSLATQKIAEIGARFSGDAARAGKRVYYRARASVQDDLAEYGPLSTRPRGDLLRSYWHLGAAFDLMRADREYEHVTDNAIQVSECFGAAGMGRLQRLAFYKAHGSDQPMLLGVANFGAPQILELEQRIFNHVNQ